MNQPRNKTLSQDEKLDWLRLIRSDNVGPITFHRLMDRFGTAGAALDALPELARRGGRAGGIKVFSRAAAEREMEALEPIGARLVARGEPEYPSLLAHIEDAPPLISVLGHGHLLAKKAIAVVGARNASINGCRLARQIAADCGKGGLLVVSGMARGLDAVAHRAALDAGGGTVGVLGNGLGVIYPAANRALYERVVTAGCLLTEYPPGERPHAGSFPRRNRLISGLARATVVLEARDGSGALITADCALSQGREVMAVPGPITSPVSRGTNRLIQMGAKPVLELRDVLEEYGISEVPEVSLPADLSDTERRALEALGDGAELVDDVTARLACAPAESLAVLTSLEIRGLVEQGPGKVFRVTTPFESRR